MAQDSKEIAAASQRDSSAMKIIAMLTTLFLPGTFIAVSHLHFASSFPLCGVILSMNPD